MTETNEQERVRPRFLIFLCILTFSSATSGLWTRSEQLWSPAAAADIYHQAYDRGLGVIEEYYSDEQAKSASALLISMKEHTTPDTIRTSSIIFLIYESMTLFGAFFMWNLQRKGFYIYLGGIVAVFFGHMLFVGGLLGVLFSLGSVLSSGFFSILYYLNLKHME